ncbi:hypothetical protein RB2654_22038 [Rhodobacterales bacterium HTCC2654]|uniref:Uncharacterized protein n=1 Tax=Maritimibacter alkaliphilus HTCC2654 TaxID=314271 RepID=A3VLK6_9RHOB|nr:hypothetical protein RB2654_22038 [Rhodobacterales bacterium HTCC2654] [Maritimibacter alkaliphilus HTCC2654]
MPQAAVLDGLSFDLFSSFQNGFRCSEIDVGRRWNAQALAVAVVVVMIDEVADCLI